MGVLDINRPKSIGRKDLMYDLDPRSGIPTRKTAIKARNCLQLSPKTSCFQLSSSKVAGA